MRRKIPFSIVTPEKVIYEAEVDSVVAPSYDGQLGILPGHSPLLAQMVPGVLRFRSGDDEQVLAVSGGYLEIEKGRVAVFAETAAMADEIEDERAVQASEREKGTFQGEVLDKQAMASMKKALTQLRLFEKNRRKNR